MKPPNRPEDDQEWPKCSFFGVYDGHGGSGCADFLRDQLHQFIIREPSFPQNPHEALKSGFARAEQEFMDKNYQPSQDGLSRPMILDKSGSCALVVLIVGDMVYIANVGDSRAVLSAGGGSTA